MKTKFLYLAMMIPGLTNAQVMLEQNQAESGSYYKGVLSVTQGCNGAATTEITVDLPEGLQFVQPMPKPGWQLEMVKKPVERPFFLDGVEIAEVVRQITWSGNSLLDLHFDEFIFRGRIGVGATSVLYFPVTQKCEAGELHWDQIVETRPIKKIMPQTLGPEGVIDMMEEMGHAQHQSNQPKAHQHKHQHGQAKDDVEHSGDHGQPKANQHDHQMNMTKEDVMNHSAHVGNGQPTLQYPAPFVKVIDGTTVHHHH